jgi:hypothetical protein
MSDTAFILLSYAPILIGRTPTYQNHLYPALLGWAERESLLIFISSLRPAQHLEGKLPLQPSSPS